MKPGDAFDPVKVTREFNVYPVDVVDARRDLSDGPKRLYTLLSGIAARADRRKHPWLGYVYASEAFLAQRLGKDVSRIRADMKVLRDAGLIKIERPKNQGNNQYSFLWLEEFHRADSSGGPSKTEPVHRADSSGEHRADSSAGILVHRSDVSAGHRADSSGAYKENKLQVLAHTEARAGTSGEGFLEFQSAYPAQKREIAVDSSCRAYLSVIDGVPGEHEKLMAGLARYRASAEWQRRLREKPDGSTIPTMATFIGERRYQDHPPAANEAPDEYRTVPKGMVWDPASEEFVPRQVSR